MKRLYMLWITLFILTGFAFFNVISDSVITESVILKLMEYVPEHATGITWHKFYGVLFNKETKTPVFCIYNLTKKTNINLVKRHGSFTKDPDITESPPASCYANSGFDLGHIVACDDMLFDISSQACKESFFTSNVCPQYPGFNRGIWKELETAVRLTADTKNLIIIAGPIYEKDKSYRYIKGNVAIPDKFFKLIYAPDTNEGVCYEFDHVSDTKTDNLSKHIVSIDKLQKEIHYKFLRTLPEKELVLQEHKNKK